MLEVIDELVTLNASSSQRSGSSQAKLKRSNTRSRTYVYWVYFKKCVLIDLCLCYRVS